MGNLYDVLTVVWGEEDVLWPDGVVRCCVCGRDDDEPMLQCEVCGEWACGFCMVSPGLWSRVCPLCAQGDVDFAF